MSARSGGSGRFQGDLETHAFELADQAVLVGVAGLALQEVVAAKVGIGLLTGEQVPADHQDRVGNGNDDLLVPAASLKS